jgi:hypothetical protein
MPYNTSSSHTSSTSTLLSTYASEKAVLSTTQSKPAKDYSAAFTSLQTQYGFMGGNVAPTTSSNAPNVKKERCSFLWKLGCSRSAKPPTARLLSPVGKNVTEKKDFEVAFGQLQTSLGFSGSAPVRSHKAPTNDRKT